MAKPALKMVRRDLSDLLTLDGHAGSNHAGSRPIEDALLVPVSTVEPSVHQPRTVFNAGEMQELASNIRQLRESGSGIGGTGILQPLLVRRATNGSDKLIITAGERRYRAAVDAGCEFVPVLVRDQAAADAYLVGLVENLQREDLTDDEIGEACAYLKKAKGYSLEKLSALTGKNLATISQAVRIHADPRLSDALKSNKITPSHARELVVVPERKRGPVLESVVRRRAGGDPVRVPELRREIQETITGRVAPELRPIAPFVPEHMKPDPEKNLKAATMLLSQTWKELETLTPAVETRIELRKELGLLHMWLGKLEETAEGW